MDRVKAELAKEKAGNRSLYRAYRSAKDDGIRSGRKAAGAKYKGALVAYRQFVTAGRKRTTILRNLDQAKAASSIFQEVVNKEIVDALVELQEAKDELAKLQAELDSVPLPSLAGAEDLEFTPYDDRSPPDAPAPETSEFANQISSMLDSSEAVLASIDEAGESSKEA